MGYRYVILGAGRQGTACAYDLAFSEDTQEVIVADAHRAYAEKAVERLRSILPRTYRGVLRSSTVSVQNPNGLEKLFKEGDALLSAVPYYLNPRVAQAAISAGVSMCDLGGDTPTVFEIRRLHDQAVSAGITIIPDCGLAPGMCNLLAVYGMSLLDQTDSVQIRCGGLPQSPVPPLGYRLVFNLEGLINNYFGKAFVLRQGRVTEVESFTEREEILFPPPLGSCEAFITAGATSTCPWTFEGKVTSYDYKTVRYPGHYEKMNLLRTLGLLETEAVEVKGVKVAPLDLFVRVVGEKIAHPDVPDLVVLRVVCRGQSGLLPTEVNLDLLVFYDPQTRFLAMEQTTGFSAAVILQMLARREIRDTGVVPLETAIPAQRYIEELRRRGMEVKETIRPLTESGSPEA
jgi:lysine 6-dehydrogenase